MFLQAVLVIYNLFLLGVLLIQAAGSAASSVERALFILLGITASYFLLLLASRTFLRKIPGFTALKSLTFLVGTGFTTVLSVASFLSAQNQEEYLFAAALVSLPLYFWGRVLAILRPAKEPKGAAPQEKESTSETYTAAMLDKIEGRTAEPDKEAAVTEPGRRAFLKRAGGIGLGLLVYSLLNPRQAGAAFFGSVPGPGTVAIKDSAGVVIDPAEKYPTSGYGITEIDDAGTTYYFGFVEKAGSWYVLKETDTTGDLSYLYATPANNPSITNFTDAWSAHATTLTYNRFDTAF
ncbi:MAG: hypothetical protein UY40_C0004G0025 [candidate division CPR1 bacterium GW2011_GWC1_49_13]|uniref:Uncharacterized protein n=1 Tax=candidate division CPR1 bacterium GW2011_GWC1_49_13 TaxID=1618342 RepID=A0A0G1VHV2_9BACT|nr:MAG: hypothetical protein UY40_C0004G0025 [candidate division CPR1 bacterium GW2011_GWC1_49_13]